LDTVGVILLLLSRKQQNSTFLRTAVFAKAKAMQENARAAQ